MRIYDIIALWASIIISFLVVPGLVFFDARKLRQEGVKIIPFAWAFLAFILPLAGVLPYVFIRVTALRLQRNAIKEGSEQKLKKIIKAGRRIKASVIFVFIVLMFYVNGCFSPLAV